MIRRHKLGMQQTIAGRNVAVTDADLAAERVRRGESVRIVGLGTLARVCNCPEGDPVTCCDIDCPYRLTLTAAVARQSIVPRDGSAPRRCDSLLESDVRHLARALGAPVEVWSPVRTPVGPSSVDLGDERLITTVQP